MCMDEQKGQKSINKKKSPSRRGSPVWSHGRPVPPNRLWDRTRWPGPPPSKSCCMLGRLLSITRIQQPTQSFTPTPACTDTTSLCSLCSKGERRDTHPTPLHLQPVPLVLVLSFLDQSPRPPHTHTQTDTQLEDWLTLRGRWSLSRGRGDIHWSVHSKILGCVHKKRAVQSRLSLS